MLITESGITTEVIFELRKAPCQISVTDEPIIKDSNSEYELGITTEVSLLLSKAESSMMRTVSSRTNAPAQFFPSTAAPAGKITEYEPPP